MNSDVYDPGYQMLNDEEIVNKIQDKTKAKENEDECSINYLCVSLIELLEFLQTAEESRSYSNNVFITNLRNGSIEKIHPL